MVCRSDGRLFLLLGSYLLRWRDLNGLGFDFLDLLAANLQLNRGGSRGAEEGLALLLEVPGNGPHSFLFDDFVFVHDGLGEDVGEAVGAGRGDDGFLDIVHQEVVHRSGVVLLPTAG